MGDECDDVGINDNLCAVLYDEQKCKKSSSYLSLRNGDEGVLPLFTTGLRRNDVESLIVKYRCKLELWDDNNGFEKGAKPDVVIDRSSRTNLGRNKYVDSLMKMSMKIWMRKYLHTDAPVESPLLENRIDEY